ncbi:AAA family ATPase [Anabaena sp. CCY 0017]|uniref:AAA family ATPase n=1 Tax=Anabaena sp. CCY 0017 TaxID=3103866 RepID=UPI0039C636A0
MLKSVKIENFRGFKSFELQQLGRINLLVGKNNSGKTSLLEAIQLLCSRTNLEPLGEIMINRGEYIWNDNLRGERELNICHLFHDHEFQVDGTFSISGISDGQSPTRGDSVRGACALHSALLQADRILFIY